jgi:hypothetical protein
MLFCRIELKISSQIVLYHLHIKKDLFNFESGKILIGIFFNGMNFKNVF